MAPTFCCHSNHSVTGVTKELVMFRLTSVSVFLFPALALGVNSGYSLGAVILLLSSLWLLWKRPRLDLQRQDRLLIGVLLAYCLIFVLNMLYHGDPMREFDMPLRALLVIPVLLVLLAYPPSPGAWWSGLAIGAMAGAVVALIQFTQAVPIRPQGATSNPIHYGNVSMLFGMLSLCGLDWARKQRYYIGWILLLLAGCIAGVFGSIISGSRGGWLALPFCFLILALYHARNHGRRYVLITLTLLLTLLALAYLVPRSPVHERAVNVASELQKFEHTGDTGTSVGQRLVMWRTALDMSRQHVVLGLGRIGYMEQKDALVKAGKMSLGVAAYTNAHNDYLDALVKRGIPGLLALLALFLVPLSLFARVLRDGPATARPFALGGVVLCTCYIIFGLTTTSLTLNIGIIMLVFPMIMLWAMTRHQQRTA